MTCRELNDLISDYLSGELIPSKGTEFDEHLVACPPCRRYLESYRLTICAAKNAFTDPDKTVTDEVPAELVEAILEVRRRRRQSLD